MTQDQETSIRVQKSGATPAGQTGTPTPQEMELINRFTRRELTEQEVYVFTVVLCDNDIDRDYERFTPGALEQLAQLYVGKTGIFDHDPKSSGQTARIYAAWVDTAPGETTQVGEAYQRLMARAYLPRTKENQALIEQLDAGIKKEVSVGCAVGSITCSVCGTPRKEGCAHQKGKQYPQSPVVCHNILDEATDAYEWSFVAVPAQRRAGVIKAFGPESREKIKSQRAINNGEDVFMRELVKQLRAGEETRLTAEQARKLGDYLANLEQEAAQGRAYREQLQGEVLRLCALEKPELPGPVLERVTARMDLEELQAFCKAFAPKEMPGLQTAQASNAEKDDAFLI